MADPEFQMTHLDAPAAVGTLVTARPAAATIRGQRPAGT